MDSSAIRSRLAGAGGRLYWRSLGELADTPEFHEYLHREFPEQASEWNDPKGRREFLKLMSASLALAGVGACTKQPPESIVPYVKQPEDLVPGRPLFFASAIPMSGIAQPVLVESHMGRPTKIEGNPDHPASLGATDVFTQAAVLGLYDPDRAQTVTHRGEVRAWGEFLSAVQVGVDRPESESGRRTAIPLRTDHVAVTRRADGDDPPGLPAGALASVRPDCARRARIGLQAAAGAPVSAVYNFDKADVIVSLESDFLACGPGSVRYTRDFADRRRITDEQKSMNRLYVDREHSLADWSESRSSAADARLGDSRLCRCARCRGGRRRRDAVRNGPGGIGEVDRRRRRRTFRLIAARSLVVAGDYQPAAVHALAHAMNQALGNVGTTVTYGASLEAGPQRPGYVACRSGRRDGRRPGGAPRDPRRATRCSRRRRTSSSLRSSAKSALAVYHGLYADETAYLCHWNIPDTHPLETWGDFRAYDGTVTLMQPLIAPLYEGRSAARGARRVHARSRTAGRSRSSRITGRARSAAASGWTTIRDASGQPFKNADTFWSTRVHDGFIARHGGCRRRSGDAVQARTEGAVTSRCGSLDRATSRRCGSRAANSCARGAIVVGSAAGTLGARRNRADTSRLPVDPAERRPGDRAASRSSSGPIRRSGTAASRTTAGCRNCQSR